MSINRTVVCILLLCMCQSTSGKERPATAEVFKKVAATYRDMQSYQAEGTITSEIDSNGVKMHTETSFVIRLKKPNQYFISWTQKNMPMPGMNSDGAVWSDGNQPYLYMGMAKSYAKMQNDEMALGGATGISGGAAFTIPSLFLPSFKQQKEPFSRLTKPEFKKNEKIDGEECYVIGGPSSISKEETFWISKNSYQILKYYRSLEPPQGGAQMPALSEKDLEAAIKAMGKEVSEQSKREMKEMMESSQKLINNSNLKGSSVESHEKRSSPDLSNTDFEFSVSAGTVLKDSLW